MIAALILAGGQGSRLGGVDKAFVQLAGRPLLDHLLDRLAGQADVLAISANGDPARFARYALPVLADGRFEGKGPLAGLAAGLAWATAIGATALATVPVDTPFIPHDLIGRLAPAPAVALWRGRQHHLVALLPTDLLPRLATLLNGPGPYKVRDALNLCVPRQVEFQTVASGPDSQTDPFLNINTNEMLSLAATLFQNMPSFRNKFGNYILG